MTIEQLQTKLRHCMSDNCRGLSERDALEAALEVADEWRMRLDEVKDEEGDN